MSHNSPVWLTILQKKGKKEKEMISRCHHFIHIMIMAFERYWLRYLEYTIFCFLYIMLLLSRNRWRLSLMISNSSQRGETRNRDRRSWNEDAIEGARRSKCHIIIVIFDGVIRDRSDACVSNFVCNIPCGNENIYCMDDVWTGHVVGYIYMRVPRVV